LPFLPPHRFWRQRSKKDGLELIFSKGTPRWQILLARLVAGLTLYAAAYSIANFPQAVRFWWLFKLPTWAIAVSGLFESLAFVAMLSIAAAATLAQRGAALPILLSAGMWMGSPVLQGRQQFLYPIWNNARGAGSSIGSIAFCRNAMNFTVSR